MENQHEPQLTNKFSALDCSTLFFFFFFSDMSCSQNMVPVTEGKITVNEIKMKEIHRKSILVRGCVRFKLHL